MTQNSESAELQQLWEAMDTVIGSTPVSPVPKKPAQTCEDIRPILERIERREKQRKRVAGAGT